MREETKRGEERRGKEERESVSASLRALLLEMKAALGNETVRCDRDTYEVSFSSIFFPPSPRTKVSAHSSSARFSCARESPESGGEPCGRCVDRARSAHARAHRACGTHIIYIYVYIYALNPFDHWRITRYCVRKRTNSGICNFSETAVLKGGLITRRNSK